MALLYVPRGPCGGFHSLGVRARFVSSPIRAVTVGFRPRPLTSNPYVGFRFPSCGNLAVQNKTVLLGVDSLDATKGLVHKFLAVEEMFEMEPELAERINFVQVSGEQAAPVCGHACHWTVGGRLAGRELWR